jgi:hypothetical protein
MAKTEPMMIAKSAGIGALNTGMLLMSFMIEEASSPLFFYLGVLL